MKNAVAAGHCASAEAGWTQLHTREGDSSWGVSAPGAPLSALEPARGSPSRSPDPGRAFDPGTEGWFRDSQLHSLNSDFFFLPLSEFFSCQKGGKIKSCS